MSKLYENIQNLCVKNNTNITKMCKEIDVSRASLSDLKAGRSKTLTFEAITKIAKFFNVTPTMLSEGQEETREVSNNDIKFALFNGSEGITDEMFDEVKKFAEMVKLREDAKKK